MRIHLLALVAASTTTSLLTTANSQTDSYFRRDRNTAVLERQRPDYDSAPLQAGGMLIDANLQTEAGWSDNIYATGNAKTSDFIAAIRPSLELTTAASVHAFRAQLFADYQHYVDNSDESILDGGANLATQLDFAENTSLSASGYYEVLHEPRSQISSNTAAKSPIAYSDAGVAVTAEREFGRIKALVEGGYQSRDFNNAQTRTETTIEQNYRDHGTLYGRLKLDYAISPSTAIFARGRYETINFPQRTPAGLDRNQSGYSIEAGVDFDISNLTTGQIGVGFLSRQFDDPTLEDISGLSADAQINWFPSPLVTVTANAGRYVRVSGLAASPAFVETSATARIDYEVRQNILVFAQGQIGEDKYDNLSLTDSYTSIEGGALWLMNRNITVSIFLRRRDGSRTTPVETGSDANFSVNRVGITLVARP